jgi:hypothetical protein
MFGVLVSLCRIGSITQIGADEGFELSKATMCLNGYKLYADVWNDQPPLHTWIVTKVLRLVEGDAMGVESGTVKREESRSAFWPRMVTVFFAMVLVGAVFVIGERLGSFFTEGNKGNEEKASDSRSQIADSRFGRDGLIAGIVAAVVLMGSPGFVELSSSCMLEIPALSMAVAGIAVLMGRIADCGLRISDSQTENLRNSGPDQTEVRQGWKASLRVREVVAGVLFGLGCEMKLIGAVLIPIACLVIWVRGKENETALTPRERETAAARSETRHHVRPSETWQAWQALVTDGFLRRVAVFFLSFGWCLWGWIC